MNFEVYNRVLHVDHIDILAVASSSVFMIGDTETIQLTAAFDTPPESLIIGPFVPLERDVTPGYADPNL
ncbi:spore gernimation protein GerPD [Neobacillus sp. NPDC058068]|uniref:spore gernimation protein GerPD n=1 Tax=Neobacillus sp. NPDC058068 TaxID=3346325 RepID=UPI0036DA0C6E